MAGRIDWDGRLTRRRLLSRAAALGIAAAGGAALVACGSPSAGKVATPEVAGPALGRDQTAGGKRFTAVLPNSELAVGPNSRFLLGVLDKDNRPVTNLKVQLRFYTLSGSQVPQQATATLKFEATPKFYTSPAIGERGLYVARVGFDTPGPWAVEVVATPPDGPAETLRLFLTVEQTTKTPPIGSVPPASKTPVAATPAEAEKICSARPPDDMHDLSIADVLGKGKPLAVVFATPAYCTSQLCGPDVQVVQDLKRKYGAKVNFIHVEIWQDAKPGKVVPAVDEWKLPSEPWLFLMDAQGKVYDKFEGGITTEELDPVLAKLAGA
jgi:hypothetical protein